MTTYITNAGKACQLRALNGETLVFTRVCIGSGSISYDPSFAVGLNHQEMNLSIDNKSVSDGLLTLSCYITNTGVTTGFKITEYGIYVKDMDYPTQELLYAYISESDDSADYVPAASDRPKNFRIEVKVNIGTVQNLSVVINSSLGLIHNIGVSSYESDGYFTLNMTFSELYELLQSTKMVVFSYTTQSGIIRVSGLIIVTEWKFSNYPDKYTISAIRTFLTNASNYNPEMLLLKAEGDPNDTVVFNPVSNS